ncbi:hypothetical protein OC842_001842 [Tilletia horrida]|uniref:ER-bound oxygenase mpaB/mpaB'/Rubber oxygenase catalytic domain-containing protein n=1 Tax=Tilletia horrida TaxID=155126 RepID=A0AAN6JMZ9_9BASI|nr:hypothetical protein OC842_001842 [Tilletia horrida]KAK0566809.1 hypothetical protein OC844_000558 [Tilletia horrida]
MQITLVCLLVALSTYLLAVRRARYQIRDATLRRYSPKYAVSVEEAKRTGKPRLSDPKTGLQGVHDAQRILRAYAMHDMVFTVYSSLQFALFITYGIPSISSLLKRTSQLSDAANSPRRYVDTASLIASYLAYPLPALDLVDNSQPDPADEGLFEPDDPRSAIAMARTNFLHDRWRSKISRDDMLLTLCTFIEEPPKWVALYEWRQLTELEKEASFAVWRHIGRCFRIADIPETREALAEWREEYESRHMVFAESNQQVGGETVELLLWHVPKFFHPFARKVVVSLMYERLRLSMGYEKPSPWIYTLTYTLLRLRANFIKHLMLPRKTPKTIVPFDHSKDYFTSVDLPAVCPASGARASEGRTCPVGGHAIAEKDSGTAVPKGPRMTNTWFDVMPMYSLPAKRWSARWVYERVCFVDPAERWGAAKWRASTLAAAAPGIKAPVEGLGGFRLEELGPAGLERKGIDEIKREAERLNGGRPLKGPWAIP